jgi:hypothetical protein
MRGEIGGIIKSLVMLAIITIAGALLLSWIEELSFGESLYRTFLLIATVAEYPAMTAAGKITAAALVLLGLGIILYLVISLGRAVIHVDIMETIRKLTRRKYSFRRYSFR